MDKRTALNKIATFRRELERQGIQVDELILYGSYATDTFGEYSDIDLIVISGSFRDMNFWQRIDVMSKAIMKEMAPIEPVAFSPEEWQSGNSLLKGFAENGISVLH